MHEPTSYRHKSPEVDDFDFRTVRQVSRIDCLRRIAIERFAASRSSVSPHRDRAFRRVHHHQCDFLVGYRIEKTYDVGKVLLGSVEGGEVFSKGGLAGHGSSVFVSVSKYWFGYLVLVLLVPCYLLFYEPVW